MGTKAYPKSTLKKIVKAHSNHTLKKDADVSIYLNYVLFMDSLIKEAAIQSKQSGERGLTTRSVKKATRVSMTTQFIVNNYSPTVQDILAKFKG
ncbi:hypothetical protein LLEC1_06808 [Akanthomyces lecanii]|uniref:Transcription factor CBF/NF-Y/archaeal histone domain-containing protein n=1 Tax=Cordyceps confragosa TaxID=2714763 RepID=A0A179I705_CORDF|nr:hypothetical protein LLEC1_06808 [Akanthomyces lecanii]